MSFLNKKRNQIHFKAVETPTAWILLAIAWKQVDGQVIYSEPKVVRVVQKPESALVGKAGNQSSQETILLAGISAGAQDFVRAVVSPFVSLFTPERSGSLAWYGARPPCV